VTGKNLVTGEDASRGVAFAGLVSPAGGGQLRAANDLAQSAAKPALGAIKAALAEVHEIVGKLPKGKPGKWDSPQRGTSKKGYRLDPGHADRPKGHPESGAHINWWDYSEGKRNSGGRAGAVPIPPT
jgi:hypothetical protein